MRNVIMKITNYYFLLHLFKPHFLFAGNFKKTFIFFLYGNFKVV